MTISEPDFVFESDLKTVYHFRKHRGEFGGCTMRSMRYEAMRYYLCDLPKKLFVKDNLRNVAIGVSISISNEKECRLETLDVFFRMGLFLKNTALH